EECKISALPQVFLCYLEFHHQRCFWCSAKQRMKRLTGHKINSTVFHLHHYIAAEFSIQRYKFIIGLLVPVFGVFGAVYKCSPHNDASMWCNGICQHIGAIGMRTFIVLRAGLPFAVCFYEETAKVRNVFIYFIHLCFPPAAHFLIQRVSRFQFANFNRSAEAGSEEHFNTVRPECISQRFYL